MWCKHALFFSLFLFCCFCSVAISITGPIFKFFFNNSNNCGSNFLCVSSGAHKQLALLRTAGGGEEGKRLQPVSM